MPIPITSQSNALSQAYPHLTTENYNILKDFLDKIETIDGLRLDSIHEWPIIPDDGSGISSSLCCRNILIICEIKVNSSNNVGKTYFRLDKLTFIYLTTMNVANTSPNWESY